MDQLYLLILSFLESVFYFHPKTKIFILGIIALGKLCFIIFWITYYQKSKNNKISRYKTISLSKALGKHLYPPNKSDTVLNALQLESGTKENESGSLAESYIKKIKQRLKLVDLSLLADKKIIFDLKKYLIVSWAIVISLLAWNYNAYADSFNRWASPIQEFPAPKPFNLYTLSGSIHILGGDKSEIKIKASPSILDTINLYLRPCQASTKKKRLINLKIFWNPR